MTPDDKTGIEGMPPATGSLPLSEIPAEVAGAQSLFQENLKMGVPAEKFSNIDIKPEDSGSDTAASSKGRYVSPDHYRMYLVRSHLEEIQSETCVSGKAYKAWIAARPYLFRQVNEPAMVTTFTRPYEVEVCLVGTGITYEILSIGNAIPPN